MAVFVACAPVRSTPRLVDEILEVGTDTRSGSLPRPSTHTPIDGLSQDTVRTRPSAGSDESPPERARRPGAVPVHARTPSTMSTSDARIDPVTLTNTDCRSGPRWGAVPPNSVRRRLPLLLSAGGLTGADLPSLQAVASVPPCAPWNRAPQFHGGRRRLAGPTRDQLNRDVPPIGDDQVLRHVRLAASGTVSTRPGLTGCSQRCSPQRRRPGWLPDPIPPP